MVNNEAKPKQISSMLGLKQASFKRKGKGVSRVEYDLKKKLAQVKPCPKSKKFKKKRHKEFGVCFRVPASKPVNSEEKHVEGFLACFHCNAVKC